MKAIKVIALLGLIGVVAVSAFLLGKRSGSRHGSGSAESASGEHTFYTCGMHPNVIQDKPGICPICEMKLTPLRRAGGAGADGERKVKYYQSTMHPGEISQEPAKDSMGMDMVPVYEDEAAIEAAISIDPVTIQNMAIRTAVLTNGPLRRVIRTVAAIEYAEPDLADVTTKYKGWVEKLYVDAVGAQVGRGDPLFEIYSPELYSAQAEYLLALQGSQPGAEAFKETARTKLKYWDISEEQIAELERTRVAQKTLKVLAPIDGVVTEKMVVQGQMVDGGMRLYRIADLGLVWVRAQIYEQDLPFIRLGQEAVVSLSYLPDRKFRGCVTCIYPNLDPKTRTAQVRMEFHNPGYFLKPGMFAAVELVSEISPSALLVPDMAVLRSGAKDTVFVTLEGGKFEPRTVTLGARAEHDMIQVLSGLAAGERVVTSGQFMLDSESQLREAIQKMLSPREGRGDRQGREERGRAGRVSRA
jgi:RND family efflux transporter MFP subunit